MRKSVPCSFGEIGYGSASPISRNSLTCNSAPPGARGSATTLPVTPTVDSCVARSESAHEVSSTSFLETTHCMNPLPSRTIGNCSFPEVRLLYSQPLT